MISWVESAFYQIQNKTINLFFIRHWDSWSLIRNLLPLLVAALASSRDSAVGMCSSSRRWLPTSTIWGNSLKTVIILYIKHKIGQKNRGENVRNVQNVFPTPDLRCQVFWGFGDYITVEVWKKIKNWERQILIATIKKFHLNLCRSGGMFAFRR